MILFRRGTAIISSTWCVSLCIHGLPYDFVYVAKLALISHWLDFVPCITYLISELWFGLVFTYRLFYLRVIKTMFSYGLVKVVEFLFTPIFQRIFEAHVCLGLVYDRRWCFFNHFWLLFFSYAIVYLWAIIIFSPCLLFISWFGRISLFLDYF